MKSYNENRALTEYFIKYYSDLFDKFSKKILHYKAIMLKFNGDSYDLFAQHNIRKKDLIKLEPYLNDALYWEYFEKKVFVILKNKKNKIIINRCPKCKKITRTNNARQCRFCGFDWH